VPSLHGLDVVQTSTDLPSSFCVEQSVATQPKATGKGAALLGPAIFPAPGKLHSVEFTESEKRPDLHVLQTCARTSFWYVPGIHGVHCADPTVPCTNPAGHKTQLMAAGALKVPLEHSKHTRLFTAPTAELNLPAAHALQVAFDDAPTAVEYIPASHGWQLVGDDWPAKRPNLPDGQLLHKDVWGRSWKKPVEQLEQFFALACETFPGAHGRQE
jgi:hypothetical protein